MNRQGKEMDKEKLQETENRADKDLDIDIDSSLFRKKAIEKISSPEQLTTYLKVTNTGVWVVLVAIILILAGLFAWASVGTLETTEGASAVVRNHTAEVYLMSSGDVRSGMPLRIASEEYKVASVKEDEHGRDVAVATVDLPDGEYEAEVVTERTHPIEFLFESR